MSGPATSQRLVLDAMGGDRGPVATVAAARDARLAGLDVVLVGDAEALAAAGLLPGEVPTVHAGDHVGMGEAATAVRTRPRASVRVAAALLAAGAAGAMVSAGPTGATVTAALLELGPLPGVRRPVLAVLVPTRRGGFAVLVDAGATLEASPEFLLTAARLGVAYARSRGAAAPRVGLLNVGAERGKGTALIRTAGELLAAMPGFAGNVEPAAVLDGAVEVVVTDGFTGNIFLKTLEATADTVGGGSGPADGRGAGMLLGVGGAVFVAHGAAAPGELVAALHGAADAVSRAVAARVAASLRAD